MNIEEYARMDSQETSGWWFVGKRLFVRTFLDRFSRQQSLFPILDTGCGCGAVLHDLECVEGAGSIPPTALHGVEAEPEAIKLARKKTNAALVCGSAEQIPYAAETFGTVLMLDVLEHLVDDGAALIEAHRVLCPGGILLATAPAFPWLWCDHDVALHHYRRYYRCDLEQRIANAGFAVCSSGYLFASTFPAAAAARLWRRFHTRKAPRADIGWAPPALNALLIGVMRLECLIVRRYRLPLGSSIVIVARKA